MPCLTSGGGRADPQAAPPRGPHLGLRGDGDPGGKLDLDFFDIWWIKVVDTKDLREGGMKRSSTLKGASCHHETFQAHCYESQLTS